MAYPGSLNTRPKSLQSCVQWYLVPGQVMLNGHVLTNMSQGGGGIKVVFGGSTRGEWRAKCFIHKLALATTATALLLILCHLLSSIIITLLGDGFPLPVCMASLSTWWLLTQVCLHKKHPFFRRYHTRTKASWNPTWMFLESWSEIVLLKSLKIIPH